MSSKAKDEDTQPAERGSAAPATPYFGDEVIDDAMAAVLRTKTPSERLEIGFRLWRFARQLALEAVRREHPD